jgi:hypothetical protein
MNFANRINKIMRLVAGTGTKIWVCTIALLISDLVLAAERISTASIADVQNFVTKKKTDFGADAVLVVFDFDNTLMAMDTDVGSDQWYQWQSNLIKANEKKLAVAGSRSELFDLHYKMLALGDMHPVEADTVKVVKSIQEMKVKTFVLTSRGNELRNDAEIELDRAGMNFKDSAPGPVGGYPGTFLPEGLENARVISYENGLLMGSGQNKGLLLKAFLNKTGAKYKALVFVDDTLRNVENVENEFKTDSAVTTFYYTHEEKRVQKFEKDKSRAIKEWKTLKPALDLFKKESSAFQP